MKTRAHRTPLSIWIIAAIWLLGALAPTLRWTMDERSTGGGAVVALLVVTLVLIVCHAVALMMNWALFGRPYRPVEDQAEIFA